VHSYQFAPGSNALKACNHMPANLSLILHYLSLESFLQKKNLSYFNTDLKFYIKRARQECLSKQPWKKRVIKKQPANVTQIQNLNLRKCYITLLHEVLEESTVIPKLQNV